jgi:hypothetical protein
MLRNSNGNNVPSDGTKFRLHKIAIFDLVLPYRGRGILSRTNFYPDEPPTFVGGSFRWTQPWKTVGVSGESLPRT